MKSEQLRKLIESGELDRLINGLLDRAFYLKTLRTKGQLLRESKEYQKRILEILGGEDRD